MDSHGLSPELASRMAVAAVSADIEYWARADCGGDQVGIHDFSCVVDVIREASTAEADSSEALPSTNSACYTGRCATMSVAPGRVRGALVLDRPRKR